MLKNNKGFTLTELIVTIAVSGIFFALIGSIIYSLLSAYKNTENAAAREEEIKAAWNLIEMTVEDANRSGEKVSVVRGETSINISFGTSEANLIYEHQSSLSRNGKVLTLKFIRNFDVFIINDNTLEFVLSDDLEHSQSRIFNLYGGVEA